MLIWSLIIEKPAVIKVIFRGKFLKNFKYTSLSTQINVLHHTYHAKLDHAWFRSFECKRFMGNLSCLLACTSNSNLSKGHVVTTMTSLTHMASHRTTLPVCDGFASLCFLHRKHRGAPSGSAGSERIEALRYQRVKKAKKVGINNNNSKTRRKTGEKQLTSFCGSYTISLLYKILRYIFS